MVLGTKSNGLFAQRWSARG